MRAMIYLFHGKDDYSVRAALRDIRNRLRADDGEMLDSNSVALEGRALTPGELLASATAVPFLAQHRLVVVEGLLGALGGQPRGGRRKKASSDDPLEPWRQAAATLADAATMPPSTTLVFIEGELQKSNAAFPVLAPIAQVREFQPLDKQELIPWIETAAKRHGVQLAPRAVAALAQLAGPDLWTLNTEIEKLAAFANGDVVDHELVEQVASIARETKVWDLTDGIVEGDAAKALGAMRRLLADGDAPQMLLFMIARQFRQLVIVKDMRDARARPDEIQRASGVPAFRTSAVMALASRYGWATLREAYARILEADLDVKRGLQSDEASLQLLVHELCALAPGPRIGRPAGARG